MKLEDYEAIGKLRQRLVDVDKQLAEFATMTEPNMAWPWHGGLLTADIRHPTEYRAGSVKISIPVDYVGGALQIQRQIILGELRELGVETEGGA